MNQPPNFSLTYFVFCIPPFPTEGDYLEHKFLWKTDVGTVLLENMKSFHKTNNYCLSVIDLKTIRVLLFILCLAQTLFDSQYFQFIRCSYVELLFKLQGKWLMESLCFYSYSSWLWEWFEAHFNSPLTLLYLDHHSKVYCIGHFSYWESK